MAPHMQAPIGLRQYIRKRTFALVRLHLQREASDNRGSFQAATMQAVGARASGSAVAFTPGVKASHRCHKAASAGLRSSSTRQQVIEQIQPRAPRACGLMKRKAGSVGGRVAAAAGVTGTTRKLAAHWTP